MSKPEEEGQDRASRVQATGSPTGEPVYDKGPSLIWFFVPILIFTLLIWFTRTP